MTPDLFLAHKHAQWQRLIEECTEARRKGFRQRAVRLQRRIDALALEILEMETGRQAA